MKFDLRNFSLRTLVSATCGLLILVFVLHFFVSRSINSDLGRTVSSMSQSHQLRINTYEILDVINKINSGQLNQKDRLTSFIKRHQKQLRALEQGSELSAETAQSAFLLTTEKWIPLELNIRVFLYGEIKIDSVSLPKKTELIASNTESALKIIQTSGDAYLDALSELTVSFEQELMDTKQHSDNVRLFFLMLEVLIMATLLWAVFKYILAPMKKLATATEKLSSGEQLEIDSKHYNNELGLIHQGLAKLSQNISDVTNFVKEIGDGNLEATLSRSNDELSEHGLESSVVSMRDQMKLVQKEESIRKWSTEGLAEFVEILRASDNNVHELGDKIISKLVEYTNSNQGGLYLINEDEEDPYLELISLYAFNNKKFQEKSIRLGEGLVGQTYLERKTTYLLEIPNDYIEIVSGLGGSNPKAILIVPLMVNKEIYGVLEIASFNEYAQHEIEFIEKLGESIASTISGVKVNQRTKQLLKESQQLTEQMQAQEEEMRQNMEELTATQEEMTRAEKQQYAQKSTIEQCIGIAEYDSAGNILFSNNEFSKQLGFSKEHLLSMNLEQITNDKITGHFKGFLTKKGANNTIHTYSIFNSVTAEGESKMVELSLKADDYGAQYKNIDSLEYTLRQQLEALDITQMQLDKKINTGEEDKT